MGLLDMVGGNTPPIPPVPTPSTGSGGGGSNFGEIEPHDFKEREDKLEIEKKDDDIIELIISAFVICQN